MISVDWGPRTLGMSNMNYWNAVETVPLVGVHLANFVQFLINHTGVTGLGTNSILLTFHNRGSV